MAKRPRKPIYAAGILERNDNRVLIVLPRTPDASPRLWQFPRGKAQEGESPEAAMRRIAREQLGLSVEIVIGQPPLVEDVEGEQAELRYFYCGILSEEKDAVVAAPYAELRWIERGHLREYELDPPSKFVANWLMQEGR